MPSLEVLKESWSRLLDKKSLDYIDRQWKCTCNISEPKTEAERELHNKLHNYGNSFHT